MELKSILTGIEGLKVRGDLDLSIKKLESDSRAVKKGDLFVAIKGFDTDGHEYIAKAIENGAIAVLAQADTSKEQLKAIPENITLIVAPDTRLALATAACNFYQNPSREFKLIGVTGTKGKTTTTYMIKEILEKQGKKVGLIGTIATYIAGKKLEDSDRTTPESLKLQQLFRQMADAGCEAVVMEVSSQSLKLNRVAGCDFDIGVFTNFSDTSMKQSDV